MEETCGLSKNDKKKALKILQIAKDHTKRHLRHPKFKTITDTFHRELTHMKKKLDMDQVYSLQHLLAYVEERFQRAKLRAELELSLEDQIDDCERSVKREIRGLYNPNHPEPVVLFADMVELAENIAFAKSGVQQTVIDELKQRWPIALNNGEAGNCIVKIDMIPKELCDHIREILRSSTN